MGHIAYRALVVTADVDDIGPIHAKAVAICGDYVGPIQGPHSNGACSFLVAPDGSKTGWAHSNEAADMRARLMDSLEETFADYVEVCFGGDDPQLAEITRHN